MSRSNFTYWSTASPIMQMDSLYWGQVISTCVIIICRNFNHHLLFLEYKLFQQFMSHEFISNWQEVWVDVSRQTQTSLQFNNITCSIIWVYLFSKTTTYFNHLSGHHHTNMWMMHPTTGCYKSRELIKSLLSMNHCTVYVYTNSYKTGSGFHK